MSSIGFKLLSASAALLVCILQLGCVDQGGVGATSEPVSPIFGFRKGNTTLQMDVLRSGTGDLVVTLTALADVPYVDLRTRSGDQWLELARVYDLKAGEPQELVLQAPGAPADYVWGVAGGPGPRWVTQSRIIASDGQSASAQGLAPYQGHARPREGQKLQGPRAQKLKVQKTEDPRFPRRKVMY